MRDNQETWNDGVRSCGTRSMHPVPRIDISDIRIKGSFLCSPREAEEMLDVVVKHNIQVKSNIFYGIHEIPKVVDLLRQGGYQGKGVIVIDEESVKGQESPR